MKKILFVVLMVLTSACMLFAQVNFDRTSCDLGKVNAGGKRYADYVLTNHSKQTVFILRAQSDRELSVKYSKKVIPADSSAIVRIQYNPQKTGRFKKVIPLYISSSMTPITLTLKGDIESVSHNALQNCPDFSTSTVFHRPTKLLHIHIRDSLNEMPVKDASVTVIRNGLPRETLYTNSRGEIKKDIPVGLYYFVINKPGYETQEIADLSNQSQDNINVALFNPAEVKHIPVNTATPPPVDSVPVAVETPTPAPPVVIPDTTVVYKGLPLDKYKPNNIVFLIDVSGSMKQSGKLELLKASMIKLLDLLRPIDRLAIVTYASGATTVLPSTPVTDKDKISSIIQHLEAGGNTSGGTGIKAAYKVAAQNYINGGNNEVIIATDGAFNGKQDKDFLNSVKKYASQGIGIAVVGIKNDDWTVHSMQTLADKGNGRYIHIGNYREAKHVLKNEIMDSSLKK